MGFPGCLAIAVNLITSWFPRPPLSLPKASAGFAADSHMACKALKPPAAFLMGAVTNLALRHQPSNQIFRRYLLRTHLGSMGFGISQGWRGPETVVWGGRGRAGAAHSLGTLRGAGLAVGAGPPGPAPATL